jgi:hypothetical protein
MTSSVTYAVMCVAMFPPIALPHQRSGRRN